MQLIAAAQDGDVTDVERLIIDGANTEAKDAVVRTVSLTARHRLLVFCCPMHALLFAASMRRHACDSSDDDATIFPVVCLPSHNLC